MKSCHHDMRLDSVCIIFTCADHEKQEELKELVAACEKEVVHTFYQDVKSISFRTYIGSGKVEEINSFLQKETVDYVLFDVDLSPLQIRNLETIWNITVMDRSDLILTIFEQRAQTKVAKLQIESAKLKKLLPRLIGSHTQLSRQAGGKNKGSGETQLELDRRRTKARIHEIKKELLNIQKERATQRKRRLKQELPCVALVGYTNAGKSTLMNAFLNYAHQQDHKKVFQKDMLFATLDTTIRRIQIKHYPPFLLSDTVGFVSDLPHDLIEAFHSTLEEMTYADLLIQVVDASNENLSMQQEVTQRVLHDIQADHIPMITIYNKCDKTSLPYPRIVQDHVYMSAIKPTSFEALFDLIHQKLNPDHTIYELILPYEQSAILSYFIKQRKVIDYTNKEDGIHLQALLSKEDSILYKKYIQKN